VVGFFVVLFFVIVVVLPKPDLVGGQQNIRLCIERYWTYSAHTQWYASEMFPGQRSDEAQDNSRADDHMRTLEAGILYFALVFVAGFALGTIRTLWVVPRTGARMAELVETPIMLAVTIFSARWIIHRLVLPDAASARLGMGGFALLLMLMAEFGFVLRLRKLTLREYFATRDPVAGTVYYVMLVVLAVLPVVIR
jgi:hypothetical protein